MTPFLGLGMYNIYPIDHHNDQGYREDLPYFAGGLRLRYALCYAIDVGINAKIIQAFGSERKFKLVTNTVKSHHNFCSGEIGIPIIWHLGCTQRWIFNLNPIFLEYQITFLVYELSSDIVFKKLSKRFCHPHMLTL